jgi:hypothetical protein
VAVRADGGCAAGDGTAVYPHGSGRIVPDSPKLTGRGGGCGYHSESVRATSLGQRKLHPCSIINGWGGLEEGFRGAPSTRRPLCAHNPSPETKDGSFARELKSPVFRRFFAHLR